MPLSIGQRISTDCDQSADDQNQQFLTQNVTKRNKPKISIELHFLLHIVNVGSLRTYQQLHGCEKAESSLSRLSLVSLDSRGYLYLTELTSLRVAPGQPVWTATICEKNETMTAQNCRPSPDTVFELTISDVKTKKKLK